MPTDTPDQQITLPVDLDAADNPVAFNQAVGDIEPRLVREYTTEADRTAKMLALSNGDISVLTAPSVGTPRTEAYDGTNHVSLFTRSVFGRNRVTTNQAIGPTNTTLTNVTNMSIAVPGITNAIFLFEAVVFYDSSAAGDIRFAFTIPAGASMRWGVIGLATTSAAAVGDVVMNTVGASGTGISLGGSDSTFCWSYLRGDLTMGATAGNLQLQAAQATSDAFATSILARSSISAWRIS